MKTTDMKIKSASIPGHTYAYRFFPKLGGWFNQGMIPDDNRQWWANYYKSNPDRQHGESTKVAFVPFCIVGTNFISEAMMANEAIEII